MAQDETLEKIFLVFQGRGGPNSWYDDGWSGHSLCSQLQQGCLGLCQGLQAAGQEATHRWTRRVWSQVGESRHVTGSSNSIGCYEK